MAKGLAVISGSNTVVFKALENGVVKMGGVHPGGSKLFAGVTISGSLAISGSEGVHLHVSGSEFKLENLSGISDRVVISGSSLAQAVDAEGVELPDQRDGVDAGKIGTEREEKYELRGGLVWSATSSIAPEMSEKTVLQGGGQDYLDAIDLENQYEMPDDFLVITKEGELRRVNKIDASAVMLNDGQTVEQQVGGLSLDLKLSSSHGLGVDGVDEKDVNLTRGSLNFKDVANRTHISMSNDDSGESVEVLVDLDPDLQVETLSASMGLEVTGSSKLKGNLHVVGADAKVDGDLDVHGSGTVDGDLTVKGNLNVWGDTTITTAESKHLVIEDALIRLGTDHSASTDGSDGVDIESVQTEFGFLFGDVNTRALVLDSGDLYFGLTGSIAAGNEVTPDYESAAAKNLKLHVPNLSASADIQSYTLSVLSNADVGGTFDVTGASTFGSTVTIAGKLTVNNSGSFTGDLNVDGTGSFGQSVTLRSGADLTLEQGNATLTQGDLTLTKGNATLSDGDLSVNGVTTLSASLGGDQLALDVTGRTLLSSSTDSDALHVESGDVKFDDALTVGGAVRLNDAGGALNVSGSWTSEAAVQMSGSLQVKGNVSLGDSSDDRVIVNGQFRAPIFEASTDSANLLDFAQRADQYVGYMFYLKGAGTTHFPNGNKWYFNEGGVWHSSFFWDDGAEAEEGEEV